VLARRVIIGISRIGQGLAVLSMLWGIIRVGGLIIIGVMIWVLVLAVHDRVWRKGDGKFSSCNIEEGTLYTSSRAQLCDTTIFPPPTMSCQVLEGRHWEDTLKSSDVLIPTPEAQSSSVLYASCELHKAPAGLRRTTTRKVFGTRRSPS